VFDDLPPDQAIQVPKLGPRPVFEKPPVPQLAQPTTIVVPAREREESLGTRIIEGLADVVTTDTWGEQERVFKRSEVEVWDDAQIEHLKQYKNN
jgi:hypothetical protein